MVKQVVNLPVRATKCKTCPWQEGSKYAYLKPTLAIASLTESRICHSTGADNAINKRTGFPEHICRGSRELQLEYMANTGVIDAPTDEAWNAKRIEFGMMPQVIADPEVKR